LPIEELVLQHPPPSTSNRNPSHPGPSDDRGKSSPHEKKMTAGATTRHGRNQKQILRSAQNDMPYAALRSPENHPMPVIPAKAGIQPYVD
jgi:hypothetical protein